MTRFQARAARARILAAMLAAPLVATLATTGAPAATLAPGWQAGDAPGARAWLILGAEPLPAAPVRSVAARLAAGAGAAPWRERLTAWRARSLAPVSSPPMITLLAAATRPAPTARIIGKARPGGPGAAPAPARLREVVVADASPIPLPAGGWLLVSGLAGLAALARRRRGA